MNTMRFLKAALLRVRRPELVFHSESYSRHNQRRQEHLATLGLDLTNRSVLEVGAGIGDHTSFFLDRHCRIVTSDGRPENVAKLRKRFEQQRDVVVRLLDLDSPDVAGLSESETFDIVYCYGLLYHLSRPAEALQFLARHCSQILLLELCVSFGDGQAMNLVTEAKWNPSQACTGTGCRPTRSWVMERLRECFEYAYLTKTQPFHEEFPIEWSPEAAATWPLGSLSRAVFVASRRPLTAPSLSSELLVHQSR